MACRGNSILCIVPPHVLREVAQRGSENQREWAWRTLTMSEQVRGQRQVLNIIAALGVTPVGQNRCAVYDAERGASLSLKFAREDGDRPTVVSAVDEASHRAVADCSLNQQEL